MRRYSILTENGYVINSKGKLTIEAMSDEDAYITGVRCINKYDLYFSMNVKYILKETLNNLK